jgi:hypothetical protein
LAEAQNASVEDVAAAPVVAGELVAVEVVRAVVVQVAVAAEHAVGAAVPLNSAPVAAVRDGIEAAAEVVERAWFPSAWEDSPDAAVVGPGVVPSVSCFPVCLWEPGESQALPVPESSAAEQALGDLRSHVLLWLLVVLCSPGDFRVLAALRYFQDGSQAVACSRKR